CITNDDLWNTIYPLKMNKFETPMFKKIQEFDPTLQEKILEQSFGYRFFSSEMDCNNSFLVLELWNKQNILDKLNTLYNENKELNYNLLQRTNGVNIKIPFIKDN